MFRIEFKFQDLRKPALKKPPLFLKYNGLRDTRKFERVVAVGYSLEDTFSNMETAISQFENNINIRPTLHGDTEIKKTLAESMRSLLKRFKESEDYESTKVSFSEYSLNLVSSITGVNQKYTKRPVFLISGNDI